MIPDKRVYNERPCPAVMKCFPCSTQLSRILTFISRINTASESINARTIVILKNIIFEAVGISCSVELSMGKDL